MSLLLFRPLPTWLRASTRVDLTQLAAGIRPVIRTQLSYRVPHDTVVLWARRYGWNTEVDDENFVVVSQSLDLCRQLLEVDRDPCDHTYQLGCLLGYPQCCCQAAERVGESNLDNWTSALVRRRFFPPFDVIDPSLYRYGRSFISHIPCSTRCLPSLNMAIDLIRRCSSSASSRGTGLRTPDPWK